MPEQENIKIVLVEEITVVTAASVQSSLYVLEKIKNELHFIAPPATAAAILPENGYGYLKNILTSLVNRYKAARHIIITVGHGSVLGINYCSLPMYPDKLSEQNMPERIINPVSNVPYPAWPGQNYTLTDGSSLANTIPVSCQPFTLLTNKALSHVITGVFPTKKLEVLVMHNCLMQNIFTQYECRQTVDWLVAPMSGIGYPGYHYQKIFTEMARQKNITTRQTAKLFTTTINIHPAFNSCKNEIINTWCIHAVQLDKNKYDLLKIKFDELCELLMEAMLQDIQVYNCIEETFRHLFNYARFCLPGYNVKMVDFNIFLQYLVKVNHLYFKNTAIPVDCINEITGILQTIKIYTYRNAALYANNSYYYADEQLSKTAATGLGLVYFKKNPDAALLLAITGYDDSSLLPSFLHNNRYAEMLRFFMKQNN